MKRYCLTVLLPSIALSMGCVPDPCLSQCELCAGACTEKGIAEFPNFADAREVMVDRFSALRCDGSFPYAAAGECADGQVFLTEFGGFVSETRFYGAQTGAFVGLITGTDCIDPVCRGKGYWPEPQRCDGATITEVFCGTLAAVGEQISLQL